MSFEASSPSVSIQESSLSLTKVEERPEDLTTTMEPTESEKNERPVCSFYLEGKCRFGDDCFNLHPEDVIPEEKKSPKGKEKRKKKGSKNRRKRIPSAEEEEEQGKKPSMKTAGDVRKRIQWDPDLNKDHFTVGYLDRFVGVVEKPFTAFTWEHLALIDLDQLGIPEHRIQYFCYRGTKVWDKNDRLDNVFGSAGSNTTIQEVIQEVDLQIERKRQTCDSDVSDSDDEDIVLIDDDASAIKESVDKQKAEFDQLRASHFLCIRVYNEDLKSAALEVQEKIAEQEPVLLSCAMPLELFHVTLAMIRIDTPEAMKELIDLLQDLQPRLEAMVVDPSQRKILSKGLSTFGARVLYTKLEIPEAFSSIVEMLQKSLEKIEGVVITNHFDFVPHMTLVKVGRVIARERRSKYLNSILYNDFIDRDFGVIDINNINLCVIDDRRGYDGFYLTCKRIEF